MLEKLLELVKAKDKAYISARVYRADTAIWTDLGIIAYWHMSLLGRISYWLQTGVWPHQATVLTQAGEEWVVDKLDETVQTTGAFVGWGTGAGTAAKGDTTLFTEASEARVAPTISQPLADKIRWVATLTANGAKTITNAGNFTASTGGTLIVHGDFTGIVLASGDKIEFTIDMEIT